MEQHFNTKILSLYTDGSGEFEGLKSYLESQGIEHLISPPYTPQRVAITEWCHRDVIEIAKTLLHQAFLPINFWTFACQQATYLISRLSTPDLQNKSSYELFFGESPNYTSIRTFGCFCYPWLKSYTQNKLQAHSTPYAYLGFSKKYHCHQCFNSKSSKIYLSRDVLFVEENFPFENLFSKIKHNFWNLNWNIIYYEKKSSKSTNKCPFISHEIPPPIPIPSSTHNHLATSYSQFAIHAFPAGDSTTSGNSLSPSISSPSTSADSPTPSHHNIPLASIISRPLPKFPPPQIANHTHRPIPPCQEW